MRIVFAVLCLCLTVQAQSPSQSTDTSLIQALLSEVHQLRLALERVNAIGPRIQLAVERVKLQQDHVRRISDQLDGVRHDLERMQTEQSRLAEHMKAADAELAQVTNPQERTNLSNRIKEVTAFIESQQKLEQTLRTREAELSSRLQSEQITLDGLNDRLNQIERALSSAQVQ